MSNKEKMINNLIIKNLLRNKEQLKVVAEKASDPTERYLAQNKFNEIAFEAANKQVLSDIDQLRINTFNKGLFNLDRNEIGKLESFFAKLEKAVTNPENEKMPKLDDLPKTKVDLEEFDEMLEKYNQYIEGSKSEISSNRKTLSELQNNMPLSVKNSLSNTVQAPANRFKSKFSRKTKFAFSFLNIALGSYVIAKASSLQLTNNPILTKLEELENKIKNLLEQRKNILQSS